MNVVKHEVVRTYGVEVHGLYDGVGQEIMDATDLSNWCEQNSWSFAGLIGAATRYADTGDNDASLYLIEWLVTNDGKTSQDWVVYNDIDHDAKILCGPVRVSAHEVDEEID